MFEEQVCMQFQTAGECGRGGISPLAPDHAVDPGARSAPFTIPLTLSPAPVTTTLTPITTQLDCKSMNLNYHLQCIECNAFYTGETCRSLFDHMNGHHFTTTVSNPDLSVAIHTQFHQIPFQDCRSITVE